jgi:hypothetical protein
MPRDVTLLLVTSRYGTQTQENPTEYSRVLFLSRLKVIHGSAPPSPPSKTGSNNPFADITPTIKGLTPEIEDFTPEQRHITPRNKKRQIGTQTHHTGALWSEMSSK